VKRTISCLVCIFLFFSVSAERASGREYQQIAGLIDLKTDFGDGAHDLEYLVKLARERGFRVLFINDHDRMVLEYGLFPFRAFLKKRVERPSVNKNGAENYLNMIKTVQEKYPDMIIIPGAESAAFYYWTGNPFQLNLTAHNWEKHLLLIGLEKPEDYKNLPVLHNGFSTQYMIYAAPSFFLFLLLLFLSFFLIRTSKRLLRKAGFAILFLGIIILGNSHPFRSSPFDPYHGDQGIAPYQFLIDYVHSKGGLTFWNHPETKSGITSKGPIYVNTPSYPEVLLESFSYTGFSSVYGENVKAIDPGREWDSVLIEFCEGKRQAPVYGISTADYHEEGMAGERLGNFPTIFLVEQFDKKSILSALRNGRMYAYGGDFERREILDRFEVRDKASGSRGIQGDRMFAKGPVTVHIAVKSLDNSSHVIRLELIRKGTLIKVFQGQTPFQTDFEDNYYNPGEKTYYRLKMKGTGLLVSNPVFIKFIK
jgi:hypothetical protein